MPWTLVGSQPATITAGAGTQNVTLPGPPIQGDLVLVATAADASCQNAITTAGYTVPDNTTGANPGANFGYKVMTATPDTVVAIDQDAAILRSVVVQVWRGGRATILDAAYTTPATGTSANPNATSITTTTPGALVVQVAFLDDDDTTVTSAPSNYGDVVQANTGQASTSVGSTVAIATRILATAAAEDAGQWVMGSSDAWWASAIAFAVASFGPALLSENVKVAEVAFPLTASLSESVTVDDSGQGVAELRGVLHITDTVQAELVDVDAGPSRDVPPESVEVADTVTAVLDPEQAELSESVKASDSATAVLSPLEATPQESAKVSDSAAAVLTPLESSVSEAAKITDTLAAVLSPLEAAAAESARVSDSATAVLDPLRSSGTESVLVSDDVDAERVSDADLSRQVTNESIKGDDSGQGVAELRGVLHITDTVQAELVDLANLSRDVTSESVRVSDGPVAGTGLDFSAALTESALHVTDTSTNFAELEQVPEILHLSESVAFAWVEADVYSRDVGNEIVRVADSATAVLSPLEASVTESARVSDSVAASVGLEATGAEAVEVSDSVQATLTPLQATAQETARVSDTVSAVETPLGASVSEAVEADDADVQASMGGIEASVSETAKVSDSVQARLNPLQASVSEAVRVADTVTARISPLLVSSSESIRVADTVSATLNPLRASGTESVEVSDSVSASIGIQASATEAIEVADTVTARLSLLQAAPSESARISDSVTTRLNPLNGTVQEVARLTDTVSASFNLSVDVSEDVAVSDTVEAIMTLTAGALTEPLKVTDSVQHGYLDQGTLNRSVGESIEVSDGAVGRTLTPLEADLTEGVRVAEGTFLAFIGVGAILAEPVQVSDTVAATLDPLQSSVLERVRGRDTVTVGALILTFTVDGDELIPAVTVADEGLIPVFDIEEESIS